jgi:lipoprotein-anchoring transpeptidase ErfK/SrfK
MRKPLVVFLAVGGVAALAGATRFERTDVPLAALLNVGSPQPKKAAPQAAIGKTDGVLVSIAREAWVQEAPDPRSPRIGYLRAGASVPRSAKPASHDGCPGGYYGVAPRGYVCVGTEATLDPNHPVAQLSRRPPRRDGLPYTYVRSRYPTPPLYGRLPSKGVQREREPDLDEHLKKQPSVARKNGYIEPPPADPIPQLLASGGLLPSLDGSPIGPARGRAKRRSGFALLASYEHEGRRFGLTSELALAPLDRARVVAPSQLLGAMLGKDLQLPVAIVKSKHGERFRADKGAPRSAGELARYAVVGLSGQKREHRGHVYFETTDGSLVRDDQVVRIERYREAPEWAKRGEKWIDVSILKQTLVAYEGENAVFATLVSTGADGLAEHKDTHATIQGTFLIHTKHVTATMKSNELTEEFELQDVPFVQYFTEGYALHGVYWHDDFGRPRSHGCVNLAPRAAAWLFSWTDPQVPEGWHAALAEKGTTVHVHP